MATKHKMDVPIEIGDGEVTVSVAYTFTAGTPEVRYQRNGDPGWPAEPPEIEAYEIKVNNEAVPKWFEDAACDYIHEWLHEHHDDSGPDPDDARDRRIEERFGEGH